MKLVKALFWFAVVYVVVVVVLYVFIDKPLADLTAAIQPGIHKIVAWFTQP